MARPIEAMLRPSGAAKFMACVSSPYLESFYDDKTSEFAREGTAAHELGERCLTQQCDAYEFEGELIDLDDDGDPILVDGEMCNHINDYVAYVDELLGDDCFIEHRVDLTGVLPNNGTSDCVKIYWTDGHAYVVDLKYGTGVRVDAEGNKQLRIYAIGVLQSFDFIGDINEITLCIYQPRLNHIDEFTYTRDELMAFADEVRDAVKAVYTITETNAFDHAVAGDQCTFCTAKPSCRRYHETNARHCAESFDDLTAFDVYSSAANITLAEASYLYQKIDAVKKWCTTIDEYVFEQLSTGVQVPDLKLVEGRSNRVWTDEDDIKAALAKQRTVTIDQYAPRKFLTAPALEKLMGAKKFAAKFGSYVKKPKGKPTVAPMSDRRPAINLADGFENLEEMTHE